MEACRLITRAQVVEKTPSLLHFEIPKREGLPMDSTGIVDSISSHLTRGDALPSTLPPLNQGDKRTSSEEMA